jgi:hypothetical protein
MRPPKRGWTMPGGRITRTIAERQVQYIDLFPIYPISVIISILRLELIDHATLLTGSTPRRWVPVVDQLPV